MSRRAVGTYADEGMDPALEMWVRDGRSVVELRLVGTLDSRTRRAVLDTVSDLLGEGRGPLAFDVTDLVVTDDAGARTLAELLHLGQRAPTAGAAGGAAHAAAGGR